MKQTQLIDDMIRKYEIKIKNHKIDWDVSVSHLKRSQRPSLWDMGHLTKIEDCKRVIQDLEYVKQGF